LALAHLFIKVHRIRTVSEHEAHFCFKFKNKSKTIPVSTEDNFQFKNSRPSRWQP